MYLRMTRRAKRLAQRHHDSIQPILRFQPLRDVFLRHVADVLRDQRFDFHLEAVAEHAVDFLLPGLVVLEPGVVQDFVGALQFDVFTLESC